MFTYNVLIVDDVTDNIKVAMNILKENNYNFSFAVNGEQALDIVGTKQFDIILLDIMMPVMDGFTTCKALKANELTKDTPIIFLTAKTDIDSISEAFALGAVDYISKPFHPAELIARVHTHLTMNRATKILEQNNLDLNVKIRLNEERLLRELKSSQQEIIFILTELMESTSDETGRHIKRVADLSKLVAQFHPLITHEEEEIIYHASPMHDIGKITIHQDIITSPNKLSEDEFSEMQEHTTNAHSILGKSKRKLLQAASVISHQHHEKFDGSGYPQGLAGENIHIFARVVALADVLDALTHERVYKDAWNFDEAAKYIIDRKGTQFDPKIVEIFEDNIEDFKKITIG